MRKTLLGEPQAIRLFNLAGSNSASKLTERGFLHMRIIWNGFRAGKFDIRRHVDEGIVPIKIMGDD